jgi:hypothetical protein
VALAARILSFILHPIFIPVYLFLLFTDIEPVMSLVFSGEMRWRFAISLLVTMVVFPLLSIYYLLHKGVIDSLTMPTLKGRSLSYGVTIFYYGVSLYLLMDMPLPEIIYAMFTGLIIVLLALAIISLRYKISAHMAAIGGAIGAVFWLGFHFGVWRPSLLISMLLIAGLLATARLYLQAHTESEVATGLLLGGVSIFCSLLAIVP